MISWVAMERIIERKRTSDEEFRQATDERPLRSRAKRLADTELLAKLQSFGIRLDRSSVGRLSQEVLSAEQVARSLLANYAFKTRKEEEEGDWVWVCIDALWQRWFPENASFERLDDKIQAGYGLRESKEYAAACRIWLEAWQDALQLFDKAEVSSIEEFDRKFKGSQILFNWIQDLESDLWNAGIKDRAFLAARVRFCEQALEKFEADDEQLTKNFRRALAESSFELCQTGKADELYRSWLSDDPQWGWGWIGWSDCYQFSRTEFKDLRKAEELLREGLSISGIRDASEITGRLAFLFDEQGRHDEAIKIRHVIKKELSIRRAVELVSRPDQLRQTTGQVFKNESLSPGEFPQSSRKQKPGRNDLCPCGSGKKFKKCCAL